MIDVPHRDERTFSRYHFGDQRFTVKINEIVLVVHEVEADLTGDIFEQRWTVGRLDGWTVHRLLLRHRESLVRGDARKGARATVGPIHDHRVERIDSAHTEGQGVVDARLKAPRRLELLHELGGFGLQGHTCAHRKTVRTVAQE